MKVCYLVNLYPAISNSFIRNEILALEGAGIEVMRVSVRPVSADQLIDPEVGAEQAQTGVLLAEGPLRLVWHSLLVCCRRPLRWLNALRQTLAIGWRSDVGPIRHLAYLVEACVLVNWMERQGVRHLHAHFGSNPASVAMLCRTLGGPPYSFSVHGPDEFDRPRAIALGTKIESAAFVVGISDFTRSQLCRWCHPANWDRIRVVHCGLGAAFLDEPITPPPLAPRLVCVGRLSEQKGHPILLQAAARLAAEGVRFELVVVGDGPMRHTLEEMASRLGIADSVRLVGWESNERVRERIRDARALVLPSFAEGLPVVIMEALALGRPVITSQIAGIPELVEDGVNGWLIPPASVPALVSAMKESLSLSGGRLEQMGLQGARKVRAQHDVAKEAAKLVQLFHGLRPA